MKGSMTLFPGQRITAVLGEAVDTTAPAYVTRYDEKRGTAFERHQDAGALAATAATIIAAPGTGLAREVLNINVYNGDVVSHVVTISLVSGDDTLQLWKVTLAAGESFAMQAAFDALLSGAGQSLVAVLAATPTLPLVLLADYLHINNANEASAPGSAAVSLADDAEGEVIAAPGAGFLRELLGLAVHNPNDGAATVTVSFRDGTTLRGLVKYTLAAGETYELARKNLQARLGETSALAYRGDRGKAAYDHSLLVTGNPHAVTKTEVGLGNVTNDAQLPKAGGTMSGAINMGTKRITNMADPTAAQDAVTWAAVLSFAQSINYANAVLDRDLTAPPAEPQHGDRYIVAAEATGDWETHDMEIAEYDTDAWVFTAPTLITWVPVDDEDIIVYWTGTSWSSWTAVVNHALLLNLTVGDPHTQYRLIAEETAEAQGLVLEADTAIEVAEGVWLLLVGPKLAGKTVEYFNIKALVAGETGATTADLYNVTQAASIVDGANYASIASGETLGTPATINAAAAALTLGDLLRVDVKAIASTPPQGLICIVGAVTTPEA